MNNAVIAFAGYAWQANRRVITAVLALVAGALVSAVMLSLMSAPRMYIETMSGIALVALFVLTLTSMAIFGYTQGSLLEPRSGYSDWLLRLPVSTKRLTLIPAMLITAWMSGLGLIAMLAMRLQLGEPLPWQPFLGQCLALSAASLFVLAQVWRPFKEGWHRVVSLIISAPFLYMLAIGPIALFAEYRAFALEITIAAIVVYVASICVAWHSVRLARVATYQQLPLTHHGRSTSSHAGEHSTPFLSEHAALMWFDQRKGRSRRVGLAVTFVPMLVVIALFLPMQFGSLVAALIVVAVFAQTVAATSIEASEFGCRSSLPSYLATMPVPTSTLALSRIRTLLRMYATYFVSGSSVLLLLFLWPSDRVRFGVWWDQMTDTYGQGAPLQMIVAAFLFIFIAAAGFLLRASLMQFYGQQWVVLTITSASVAVAGAIVMAGLFWFHQQRDWEAVQRDSLQFATGLQSLLPLLVVAKLLLAGLVAWRWRQHPAKFSWSRCFAAYSLAVLLLGGTMQAIWPVERPGVFITWQLTIIVLPLTPWLLAPIALAENRHRRTSTSAVTALRSVRPTSV